MNVIIQFNKDLSQGQMMFALHAANEIIGKHDIFDDLSDRDLSLRTPSGKILGWLYVRH